MFTEEQKKITSGVEGIVLVIIGIIAIVWHWIFDIQQIFVLGILLAAAGGLQLLRSLPEWRSSETWLVRVSGLVLVAAGVLLIVLPSDVWYTTIILSSYLGLHGLACLVAGAAWHSKPFWPAYVFAGLIGIAGAAVVWIVPDHPNRAWILGLVLGVQLIVFGLARMTRCCTK